MRTVAVCWHARHATRRFAPSHVVRLRTHAPGSTRTGPADVTSGAMKLSMMINYSGDFHADVKRVVRPRSGWARRRLDPRGVHASTRSARSGTSPPRPSGSRSAPASSTCTRARPPCMAQTAAGCDFVSGGRFILGLGASGPQVIEGFHGVPYEKPMPRIRDYINVVRMTLRRERVEYDGHDGDDPAARRRGHRARQAVEARSTTRCATRSRSSGRA